MALQMECQAKVKNRETKTRTSCMNHETRRAEGDETRGPSAVKSQGEEGRAR